MSKRAKVASAKSETIAQLPLACTNEDAAVDFLERHRWHGSPACPHCGSTDVYPMRSRAGLRGPRYLWRCKRAEHQFTVKTGTVMESSKIPHTAWCLALWLACSGKKGVAALEIQRQTGLSYKSALFLMHRIRFAMTDKPSEPRNLAGTIEADETYTGGKPRFQHGVKHKQGRHNTRKMEDGARFSLLVQKAEGKRLLYREQIA